MHHYSCQLHLTVTVDLAKVIYALAVAASLLLS
jgi:hypothetical protein